MPMLVGLAFAGMHKHEGKLMKTILLASASVFAFSGMAFADGHEHSHTVSFSGEAALGFNDTPEGDEDGFYWDLDIDVDLSMTLDNGLTAAASFGFEAADDDGDGNTGQPLVGSDFVLSVSNDMGGLFFGDTGPAADRHWAAAGDMEADGFSENDGETYLRGDISLSGIDASVSYVIDDEDEDGDGDQIEQLSVGIAGDISSFSFAIAFQEEGDFPATVGGVDQTYDVVTGDYNNDEIFGVSVGGSFAGADITVAYAENATDDISSTGVQVAYPFGPVTVTAYYVMEDAGAGDPDDNFGVTVAYASGPLSVTLDYDDDQGVAKTAIDASYDVGNGITVLAGVYSADDFDGDDYYIAATYDLGGGAEILVSYAEDGEGDDEVGDPEYQGGTTVELSLDF